MEERINQTLIQIENDLRSVQSARKQVDSVVESSSQLKEKVGTFVSDVSNLSKQVEKLMHSINEKGKDNLTKFKESLDALDKSCAEIISSFEEKAAVASDSVKNEVNNLHGEIEKLDAARNDLVSATNDVKNLNDNVEKLTSELKDTQSAQDDELVAIKEQLRTFSSNMSGIEAKVINIQENLLSQANTLNQLSQSLDAANTTLCGISPLIQTAKDSISNQIESEHASLNAGIKTIVDITTSIGEKVPSIASAVNSLKTQITNENAAISKKMGKSIAINRWLVIAFFVILVALQIALGIKG